MAVLLEMCMLLFIYFLLLLRTKYECSCSSMFDRTCSSVSSV